MSGEAALSQVVAASMRALMPLMFQVAIFMGFAALPQPNAFVMPGLVPGIHEFLRLRTRKTWMAGTSPAMTE